MWLPPGTACPDTALLVSLTLQDSLLFSQMFVSTDDSVGRES